jgi:hypothetical protein
VLAFLCSFKESSPFSKGRAMTKGPRFYCRFILAARPVCYAAGHRPGKGAEKKYVFLFILSCIFKKS